MIKTKKLTFTLGVCLFNFLGLMAESQDVNSKPKGLSEVEVEQKLVMAYRREFIFLDKEVRALKKRLTELKQSSGVKRTALKNDVDSLDKKLEIVRNQIDENAEDVAALEKEADDVVRDADVIDGALGQMKVSLERYGIGKELELESLKNGDQKFNAVKGLFDEALAKLKTLNRVEKVTGSFFDQQGKKIDGDIVKIGQIASYASTPALSGVLAPAGEGELKIWKDVQPAVVSEIGDSIAEGKMLPIFLYESLAKKAEEQVEKTFQDIMEAGGLIGYIIIGLGAFGLLLVIVRILTLTGASSSTDRLVAHVKELMSLDKNEEAIQLCEKKNSTVSRVIAATLKGSKLTVAELDDVISESIMQETPKLDRFESAITVVAAVAPLLGLLGTVTGMISTFDVITVYGTGDPKLLSGGISEALVTTELGLAVAIPLILLGNMLAGWSGKIQFGLQKAALSTANVMKHGDSFKTGIDIPEKIAVN